MDEPDAPTDDSAVLAAADIVLRRTDLQVRLEALARDYVVALDARDTLEEIATRPMPDESSPVRPLAEVLQRGVRDLGPNMDELLQAMVTCRRLLERGLDELDRVARTTGSSVPPATDVDTTTGTADSP